MPNTKSAEKRARQGARRNLLNRQAKSKLKTLEAQFVKLVKEGKKEEAAKALRTVNSAFDKAAKSRAIHPRTGDRKKSRLAAQLNKAS
jgi:small subunit ribosomal protein S20